MQKKHTGQIILLFILMFCSSYGQVLEQLYSLGEKDNIAEAKGFLLASFELCIVSAIMMIVPFFAKISRGKKLPFESGKRLCLWNSIILFVLSLVGQIFTGIGVVGGIGALFFYLINKWLFVNEPLPFEQEKLREKYQALANTEEISPKLNACRTCGEKLLNGSTYCPKCGMRVAQISGRVIYKLYPIEPSAGFVDKQGWEKEIAALPSEVIYCRYRDEEEWARDYRHLCYKELLKRQNKDL